MKKLNLGKELTKGDQKKVVGGGAYIVCQGIYGQYEYSSQHLNCDMAVAYCGGHQQGLVFCYDW